MARVELVSMAVVLGVTAGVARAETSFRAGDYTLVVDGSQVEVRKGKRRAFLTSAKAIPGGADTASVRADERAKTIDVTLALNCPQSDLVEHYTYDALEARLVNYDALVRHHAKDWKAAAAGFAAAAKLDPSWRLPAYNLASAQANLGDLPAAVAALAPWLASEPIATYAQVSRDPELQPLLATKELAAIRASKPGTAALPAKGFVLPISYSAERGAIAYTIDHSGWGFCNWDDAIAIDDLKTMKRLVTIPIVDGSDAVGLEVDCMGEGGDRYMNRVAKRVAARTAISNKILADLGFVSPPTEQIALTTDDSGKSTGRFPKAKLGVVRGGDGMHVLRGNTTVGTYRGDATSAEYVDAAKVMFFGWVGKNEDGCPSVHLGYAPIQ